MPEDLYRDLRLPHSSLELEDSYNRFMSSLTDAEYADLETKAKTLAKVLGETILAYGDGPETPLIVCICAAKGLLFTLESQFAESLHQYQATRRVNSPPTSSPTARAAEETSA